MIIQLDTPDGVDNTVVVLRGENQFHKVTTILI